MSFIGVVNPVTFLVLGIIGITFVYLWKRSESTPLFSPAIGGLFGILLLLHYWFATYYMASPTELSTVKQGQSLRVPVQEQVLVQPLALDVDFCESAVPEQHEHITVDTPHLHMVFDTYGALVTELSCKRMLDGKPGSLALWDVATNNEYKQGGFLLAFEQSTPLRYRLIENRHDEAAAARTLIFEAASPQATITKSFTIHDATYQIDLAVTVTPAAGTSVKPRILVPGPLVQELIGEEVVQGVVFTDRGRLEKFTAAQVEGRLWVMPTLFGAEDRYFVIAAVADPEGFIERAYYRLQGARAMTTILEGPAVTTQHTWRMHWYCGPKQAAAMAPVDARLHATLDYGWLTPISSVLFTVLQLIYQYVGNYGLAIILLTILLKLLLLPLTLRADRSQRRMLDIQKKIQFIERKYHDDPERRELEKAEIIRKHGLSDVLGLGCLPRLSQIFIFIGLNRVLSVSVDLYRAPFAGWISNLAAIDPYYILPALTGCGIFLQVRNTQGPRQLVMIAFMALMVTAIMMNFAAGVVLFICVSTWLDLLQSWIQHRIKSSQTMIIRD